MEQAPINFLHQGEPGLPLQPRRKRVIFLLILAFIGCLFIARAVIKAQLPEDPKAYDPVTLEPIKPKGLFKKITGLVFGEQEPLEGQRSDRINMLLTGMGGPGHDGPFLTDTIMVVSVKPSTKQVAMISIPRDLGIEIPGHGWKKINAANAIGEAQKKNLGGAYAAQVIQEAFNTDIHYYVRIDFAAFEEIIDELDGIKIDVENGFTDPMYPAENEEYQTVTFAKGVETMNGKRALIFARSRHGNNGEGSDFARAKRQQKVLLALKEKALTFNTLTNPVHVHNILKSLDKHLTTNMEFSDIIAMMKLAKELDTSHIITTVLDNGTDGYLVNGTSPDGAFILQPKTGNFDEINSLMEHIFDQETLTTENSTPVQDPPTYQDTNIEIQNGTWQAGLAARAAKYIQDKGFFVAAIGNTAVRPQGKSAIIYVKKGPPPEALKALQETLKIPIIEHLPESESATTTADILVILGDDYQE
ncbi:MAG TPA: hypothetical protein DCY48_04805 [Candidatus Magasanikbacteria bacterium]|nr:MAG: hypothetical protein A3I74_03285 [Candidatus Magasanikbacteria bacterium RIFCSPLOWO2_02_FULL_47_16]OGH80231.1 MAG: hypothetical protein A3C10_03565 [Candidatus Magasanikbacteria bacterium RIFCSPHIGHO2_02_FULL_48_18]OGH82129.1 MAG: hypothetical protein A3G08_02080 [Candidatus Magasanikbacteria bacterium RIFCSPLOWO2_12_FULL_47_9b]HAZ29059.1 hypothetical protein [Candidatus Magasanikbacteria bacterium]